MLDSQVSHPVIVQFMDILPRTRIYIVYSDSKEPRHLVIEINHA